MILKDISLSKTEFFLRRTEASTKDVRNLFWDDFKRVLSNLEIELAGNTHGQTDFLGLTEPPFRQGRISPILSSPWVEKRTNKLLRRFISRVFLDVFSLQNFVCQPGQIDESNLSSTLEKLRMELSGVTESCRKVRSAEKEDYNNTLKSSCLCYWVEFENAFEAEENGTKLFEVIFDTSDFKEIAFSFGRVAFCDTDGDIEVCILVRDQQKCTIFFNDLLPEYFLCWSKVKNEEDILKQSLVEDERESLNAFLQEKMLKTHLSLAQLEEINLDLSERRTAFAEKLLDVEFHLRTLEINISNAEKLLNRNLLSEQKELLRDVWVKPLRLVAEQTQAYAAYYNIILEKSRITGEKIANDASLKSAVYSRRLSFLFGLFSLIGILQLFPESFGKLAEYQKVLILAVFLVLFVTVALRTEIRNWLTRS